MLIAQRTLATVLDEHARRDRALLVCVCQALPIGTEIIWNHHMNARIPQSGVIRAIRGLTIANLTLEVQNDKTQRIVDVPLKWLEPEWLRTVIFTEPSA